MSVILFIRDGGAEGDPSLKEIVAELKAKRQPIVESNFDELMEDELTVPSSSGPVVVLRLLHAGENDRRIVAEAHRQYPAARILCIVHRILTDNIREELRQVGATHFVSSMYEHGVPLELSSVLSECLHRRPLVTT